MEDRGKLPAGDVDEASESRGKYTWDVIDEAAASDVREAFHKPRANGREKGLHVNASWSEQLFCQRGTFAPRTLIGVRYP